MCEHRSLSTPPLPGACAARHCQAPVIQGQLPQENARRASGWCNARLCRCRLAPHLYPSPPPAWLSQSPRSSCLFNPVLSEWRTDALRRPTCRGGSKSKAEPQELCKQRREREISPSSFRSSGLNLHNQLDVPASVEYLSRQRIIPKLRRWTLCDFACTALLLPFVLGFCLSVFFSFF